MSLPKKFYEDSQLQAMTSAVRLLEQLCLIKANEGRGASGGIIVCMSVSVFFSIVTAHRFTRSSGYSFMRFSWAIGSRVSCIIWPAAYFEKCGQSLYYCTRRHAVKTLYDSRSVTLA